LEILGVDAETTLGSSRVTVRNVLDQLKHRSVLAFAVIINSDADVKVKELNMEVEEEDQNSENERGVTLSSCFNGYEK